VSCYGTPVEFLSISGTLIIPLVVIFKWKNAWETKRISQQGICFWNKQNAEIKRMETTEISLPSYFIIPVFSSNDQNKMSKVIF